MRGKTGGFPKLPYLNFGYPHPLDGFSLVESAKKSLLNRLLKSILTASQEKNSVYERTGGFQNPCSLNFHAPLSFMLRTLPSPVYQTKQISVILPLVLQVVFQYESDGYF